MKKLVTIISDPADERLQYPARDCLESLVRSLATVEREAARNERPDDASGFRKLAAGRIDAVYSNRDRG